MKKIDKLIISSFIGPYLLSFFIAEFVLVMQFLWKYIDEILGKGFTPIDILEMVMYFAIMQIPMALPISILLSSVMVYGNISEKYELSSMKSAGISLLRVMKPAITIALATAILSLLASNIFKPQANFQFQKRLRSIRTQKPTLAIEEKIFNKDFDNYIIRVNKKHKDNHSIEDVLIYDHTRVDKSLINLTKSERGKMYNDENNDFVIELENGTQYTELKRKYKKDGNREYPFMRTKFKKFKKVFSTSEFDTDEFSANINKGKADMLNAPQLLSAMDSVNHLQDDIHDNFKKMLKDTLKHNFKKENSINQDSLRIIELDSVQSITNVLKMDSDLKNIILSKAKKNSQQKRDQFRIFTSKYKNNDYSLRKYSLRLNQQLSFAFICIVFVFIGAPLGSIIRKGGFGYPLLYAILFYMLFIMLAIMGEKLTRNNTMTPFMSAWVSNIILAPIAVYLTYTAMRDSNSTFINSFINFIKSKLPAKD